MEIANPRPRFHQGCPHINHIPRNFPLKLPAGFQNLFTSPTGYTLNLEPDLRPQEPELKLPNLCARGQLLRNAWSVPRRSLLVAFSFVRVCLSGAASGSPHEFTGLCWIVIERVSFLDSIWIIIACHLYVATAVLLSCAMQSSRILDVATN